MATQRKKYGLPAVERIELSERRFSARAVLAALGVAVALAVLGTALTRLLRVEPGWREIESDGAHGVHCGGDFTFSAEVRGTADAKRLSIAWSEATAKAWRLFSVEGADPGEPNLAYLNAHPGEDVVVDPALYGALRTAAAGGRYVYLAPVYEMHRSLCACEDDSETLSFDPLRDADARAFCAQAAAFARDAGAVDLAFPAENVVRLDMSDEYAAFLAENGCAAAVDFGWMKNAFIIDFLADSVQAAGLGRGAIASRDGFVRNLDASGARYGVKLFRLREGRPFQDAELGYEGPASLVTLHSFRLDAAGEREYYVFRDGATRAPHADPADGLARQAVDSLTGASRALGCGALLARLMPVYIAESFDPGAAEGVSLIYPAEDGWVSTDASFAVREG